MKIFFTSDTHFNHGLQPQGYNTERGIIPFCRSKDFPNTSIGLNQMNEHIISEWNSVVRKDDLVFHLGDFGMGPRNQHQVFYHALNGNKVLIAGNHDTKTTQDLFDAVVPIEASAYIETEFGLKVWVHHFPTDNSDDDRDYVRPRSSEPYDIALCGHVHDKWMVKAGCINVGVDVMGYRPLTIGQILEKVADNNEKHSSHF